jgi:hypothetical protein
MTAHPFVEGYVHATSKPALAKMINRSIDLLMGVDRNCPNDRIKICPHNCAEVCEHRFGKVTPDEVRSCWLDYLNL